jgi:hypothetical protein
VGSEQRPKGRLAGALFVLLGAVILAAFTQQAATAGLARLVAGLWVSVMSVIIRLFGG